MLYCAALDCICSLARIPLSYPPARVKLQTHLALASLTLALGRSKSSFSRWLCSVSLRSLSSDMLCLCGLPAFIVG